MGGHSTHPYRVGPHVRAEQLWFVHVHGSAQKHIWSNLWSHVREKASLRNIHKSATTLGGSLIVNRGCILIVCHMSKPSVLWGNSLPSCLYTTTDWDAIERLFIFYVAWKATKSGVSIFLYKIEIFDMALFRTPPKKWMDFIPCRCFMAVWLNMTRLPMGLILGSHNYLVLFHCCRTLGPYTTNGSGNCTHYLWIS